MDYTNKVNEKALLQAARRGDFDECRRLVIEVQTDVNAREDENEIGWTPLLLASRGGNAELAAFFIRYGADVNCLSRSHQSALHAACWNGHDDVVALLLSYGADVNVQNNFGQTPLHWACHYGHASIAKMLLRHGADAEIRNDMGNTALDKAISMRRSSCARVLRKHQNSDPQRRTSREERYGSRNGSRNENSFFSYIASIESKHECSDSNVSADVGDSQITVASGTIGAETKKSWTKTLNSVVSQSDTDGSRVEVDISLIEVPLEKDPEEVRCAPECSVTEYEDDETASAWSKKVEWIGRVKWRQICIICWICFLFSMVIFMAVGVAKIRRDASASKAVPVPVPSRSRTQAPIVSIPESESTLSPETAQGNPSPSVSPVVANVPWMTRTTKSPTISLPDTSTDEPTTDQTAESTETTSTAVVHPSPSAPPTVILASSATTTKSPMFDPTNSPTQSPSMSPTVKSSTAAPIPTKPPTPSFGLWGGR